MRRRREESARDGRRRPPIKCSTSVQVRLASMGSDHVTRCVLAHPALVNWTRTSTLRELTDRFPSLLLQISRVAGQTPDSDSTLSSDDTFPATMLQSTTLASQPVPRDVERTVTLAAHFMFHHQSNRAEHMQFS